jgi:hypothetical protein
MDRIDWGAGTPGPWRQRTSDGIAEELAGHTQIDAPDAGWYSLAQVVTEHDDSGFNFSRTAEGQANARAIAEVPAMVAALRGLVNAFGGSPPDWLQAEYDAAAAVLARIDGGQGA